MWTSILYSYVGYVKLPELIQNDQSQPTNSSATPTGRLSGAMRQVLIGCTDRVGVIGALPWIGRVQFVVTAETDWNGYPLVN
jgi:hypothetical protein